jgi:hypothetical protein
MTTLYADGDAIDGKRVYVECRGYSPWRLGPRTGLHRGKEASLDDAKCVIVSEYEFVKKRPKP